MFSLETQLAEIEADFAKPEFYANSAQVQVTMEKHHQLRADIQHLTEEWEKLSLEAERVQRQMEQAANSSWVLPLPSQTIVRQSAEHDTLSGHRVCICLWIPLQQLR